jgi:cytochrome c553
MKHRFLCRGAFASLLLLALDAAPIPAIGQASTPSLAAACAACHGQGGISPGPATPNLAGQKAGYLAAQLAAFKSKDRKNDLMAAIAAQLSDADMKSLAQYWSGLAASPAEGGGAASASAIRSRMAFPANFPAGFTAYQSVADEGVVTRRYANEVAVRAARAGKPLPDGSVILQVTYEAKKDPSGAVTLGAAKSYAGMESRAGWDAAIPVLLRNEDWDYALFGADRAPREALNEAPCLACHKPAAADSYLFSMKVLRDASAK